MLLVFCRGVLTVYQPNGTLMRLRVVAVILIVTGAFFTVFQLARTGNMWYCLVYVMFSMFYIVLVNAQTARKHHKH